MEESKIRETLALNYDFYKKHGEEFSKTRQSPWNGWNKCLETINTHTEKEQLSVLDIACGNGRFYKFLTDNSNHIINYLGIDNNDFMMVEAVLKYELAEFKNIDVLFDLNMIENKYDLVVAFGLTHHIPGKEFRLKWFESLPKLLNTNGILLLTFWNLSEDERFKKAEEANDLEENDYYYGWDDSEDRRYVHIYPHEELENIKDILNKQNIKLIDEYYSDGKTGNLNKYLIFQLCP
ncbi:class I SAM-dependent methyltransferase [Patescibacteria group bacterium]